MSFTEKNGPSQTDGLQLPAEPRHHPELVCGRQAARAVDIAILFHGPLRIECFTKTERTYYWARITAIDVKGTVARNFLPLVFFMNRNHLSP
jgi:hypothetical protein